MTAYTDLVGHQVDQQFLLRQLEQATNQTSTSGR
jgi:hypothetical protein